MKSPSNQSEPVSADGPTPQEISQSSLLTVSQAYEYLIAEGLPRSKKTIRKWCRLNHVEKKQNVIPGGPKWLITRSSLDARIAEERLIDASLTKDSGSDASDPVPFRTGANPSAPVRDDELVEVLKQQLAHEREARKVTEEKNRDLIKMYHEISMASTQLGIEIGKGMQEQGKARQLGIQGNATSDRSHNIEPTIRDMPTQEDASVPGSAETGPTDQDRDGDNGNREDGILPVKSN
jgi:hypothetical protein